jgi:Uma2 family endonuclease
MGIDQGAWMLIREYTPVPEEEYLRLEAQSPVRHEYVSGELFATTGGTLRHNTIALNLAVALRNRLLHGPCRVYINDVRVRVEKAGAYYYPDLLVICAKDSQPMDLTSVTVDDPVLLVEVLSERTEAIDRREKLLAYRQLPTLCEYVLVSQDEPRVEIHRRRGDIGWEKVEHAAGETVELRSVGIEIAMQEIYAGV